MPYTYLIGWSKYNKFYYGARWAKNCSPNDLWNTYFTSSKHVKEFRQIYGEPDIVQIRNIFESADKCKLHEYKTLTRLNVLTNDKWLNKNVNGRFLPSGPQTKEHIFNRTSSVIRNGKRKGKIAWTKETHPEYAKRVSDALKGKPKTNDHKQSMKNRFQNTINLTCPHCNKMGDYKNMKRWHMERCKHNINRLTDKDSKTITCTECGYSAKQSPNFYRHHNKNCIQSQSAQ